MTFNPRLNSSSQSLTNQQVIAFTNATTLFDSYSLSGGRLSTQRNLPSTGSFTSNDYYLNYTDYSLFNKTRADQLSTLANNRFSSKFVYFNPTELQTNLTVNINK